MDKVLHICVGGLAFGIFIRSFLRFGISFSLFVVVISFALMLFFIIPGPAERGRGLLFSLFIFASALGMLRFDVADRLSVRNALDLYVGKHVVLEGLVSDEPDRREKVARLIFTVRKVKVGDIEREVNADILVTTDNIPQREYGDSLSLVGKLELPKNFTDETTLREVDYRSYLAKDSIYYEMFKPKITVLGQREGNFILSALFTFKKAFVENINRVIKQPHSSLLNGLIVGAKQSLGKKLLEDFRTVGVIHIVVLSGYNITIIAYFIEWLFSRVRKNIRLILATLGMVLFAIMVGASATVVRATIMALIVILSKATGRTYVVTRALLFAGLVMLIHNPKILVFDVSFQLSFLATLGLIYFSPLIEPRVKWVTERFGLRGVVVATVATQLFVLPFILYKTGIFSIVALPVNLLILAVIPATMISGFLAGMAGFVWSVLSLPFAWVAYALLSYELGVVEWFAHLPFASVTLSDFPLWLAVVWYVGYLIIYLRLRKVSSATSCVAEETSLTHF
ncbi:MAG: ComEC family competence protein [Candidatus Taylorbacteria bacterium]|nr:ComEC family competence protein [Candidatus Taylorbacteria bacterium]